MLKRRFQFSLVPSVNVNAITSFAATRQSFFLFPNSSSPSLFAHLPLHISLSGHHHHHHFLLIRCTSQKEEISLGGVWGFVTGKRESRATNILDARLLWVHIQEEGRTHRLLGRTSEYTLHTVAIHYVCKCLVFVSYTGKCSFSCSLPCSGHCVCA